MRQRLYYTGLMSCSIYKLTESVALYGPLLVL